MFATSLATKNCVTSCRVWHPHCNLSRNFFEKEAITIRHNQNAADIFKYSAGVKYNLIAGRRTSCVRLTSELQPAIYFFGKHCNLQCARTNCLVWHGLHEQSERKKERNYVKWNQGTVDLTIKWNQETWLDNVFESASQIRTLERYLHLLQHC